MAQVSEAGSRGYSPDMDGSEHEATYVSFTHFTAVGAVSVACIVTALALGAGKHAWITTMIGVLLALVTTSIGLASTKLSWRPSAILFVVLLILLALY